MTVIIHAHAFIAGIASAERNAGVVRVSAAYEGDSAPGFTIAIRIRLAVARIIQISGRKILG